MAVETHALLIVMEDAKVLARVVVTIVAAIKVGSKDLLYKERWTL
jgi:hypothetical protein